ncbi:TraB/GumN family protein [Croceicoccus sp. F390]|uniref:TraB/GumN family protein n=1 Tax=Croceicoccus esteveae TaxID=3075597 RepID=A0ABU2ZKN4_9SPHN|nr:TraB/GumN family protein [Croceicoccus sp. F390]MDT0576618.1 TraB/GumN family protein [Croceicoccus sp. F390]
MLAARFPLRRTILLLIALMLAAILTTGCTKAKRQAQPALFAVTDAQGRKVGWLFGTIHALPADVEWQTDALRAAISDSGVLVVEVRDLKDGEAIAGTLRRLGTTTGLEPLMQRVAPSRREALATAFDAAGLELGRFRDVETWAAALGLGSALSAGDGMDRAAGTDLALLDAFAGRPIIGLETATEQLSIFDRLDEDAQLALLDALITDAGKRGPVLSDAWMRGDVQTLARLTEEGLSGNEDLRDAVLTLRNARWIEQILPLLKAGERPLVAVGAGHLGGSDGLIALLEQRGMVVARAD